MDKPTAFVTGAAKRIGARIARHLAARGYDLALHYHHSAADAEALAAELRAQGTAVTLVQADLSQPIASDFWKDVPACELLVLSAATYEPDTIATMEPERLRYQFAVNVEAPILLAQGFAAQLPALAMGQVIVLGDATMSPTIAPKYFSYALSKHVWFGAIEVLAAALAPKARANLLALGPTLPNPGEEAMFERLAAKGLLTPPDTVMAGIDYLLDTPGVTGTVISLLEPLPTGS